MSPTVSFALPQPFPMSAFDSVNRCVSRSVPGGIHPWFEFAGGWNAVAHRLRAAIEHDEAFRSTLLSSNDRYSQEKELFGFFGSGLACLESYCYANFAIGAIITPGSFPMTIQKDLKRINPESTADIFTKHFAGSQLSTALQNLIGDSTFQEWNGIRNVLFHRLTPGRQTSFSATVP